MTILYLAYWGINDGLTISTVFPHLKTLCDFEHIQKILFCTIERDGFKVVYNGPENEKINYCPLYSQNTKPAILNKVFDFIWFPRKLTDLCIQNNVKKIISRGAPAGALAYKVYLKTDIPYIVESYEPHAEYMLESGVWQWWNPKYIFETKWEAKIKKTAELIITVSVNYLNRLKREGVTEDRLAVVPCCVNQPNFQFDTNARLATRHRLDIPSNVVAGVYLGKFGGIYYDYEAFEVFKQTFEFFNGDFYLIILSPDDKSILETKLQQQNIPLNKVYITKVPHKEVPNYLSAADFAFAFYRPNQSAQYLSPIKFGEYWANGLPILSPDGIGDDTAIIEKEKMGGALFVWPNLGDALTEIKQIVTRMSRQENYIQIKQLAINYRNFNILKEVYVRALPKIN
jgi:hypothetical protein